MSKLTKVAVKIYKSLYGGRFSVDELLLHPRAAVIFCNAVRKELSPLEKAGIDDPAILRALLNRRKKGRL